MVGTSLAIMARLVLCLLVLCAIGGLTHSNVVEKLDAAVISERQLQLLELFQHIHEPTRATAPLYYEADTFRIENNFHGYRNVTAAKTYAGMLKNNWYLPRGVPFSVSEPAHAFEAMTLFNMLYSAKNYNTFDGTVAYLRDIINEGIYVYSTSIAIIYRQDTQGVALPPLYDIFPSYFNNGEIMVTAQRINTHGHRFLEYYPSTYTIDKNVVIRWNATAWPYFDDSFALSYFTNDYDLNAAQYFLSLVTPYWLGGQLEPSVIFKDTRGEAWWFAHRQLLARYYMERLSNGLGEIPEITNVVKEGYTSGLLYHNGIPFPSRPNNFRLDQPELASAVEKVTEFERRIIDAIDKGFFINRKGEHVSLLTDAGIDILGRLIESNADSPNRYYYKDFIRIWKQILGNSIKSGRQYANHFTPLVAPSALENYQTSLRDPAFYMIWKRILKLFVNWQKQMPLYKSEELTAPSLEIENIDVDKLVTFFEHSYMNVTNHLFHNEHEVKELYDDTIVLVQHPRLNHKPFTVRVNVKSGFAKKYLVKFFLAPKYDSKGYEIPLHLNTENFFLLDQFPYDLAVGENVITRKSTDFVYTAKEYPTTWDLFKKIDSHIWTPYKRTMAVYPHNLLLPKGNVGGLTFQFVVYIQEFEGYKTPYTPGYYITGFPSDRPLYSWQVKDVKNLFFKDVKIYHKEAKEIDTPLTN